MRRRDFTRVASALALTATMPALRAQGGATPVEIQDFVRLDKPVPVALPPGKRLELIEFFWYGCPHCNALEPLLAPWLKRLPADVQFRVVPVGFGARHVPGQRLYFALQAAGLAESLHAKVYAHLHDTDGRLDYDWQMSAFVARHGGDKERFAAALRAPELAQRVKEANALVNAYGVDGVPTFGVHGRFTTSPEMTGGRERCLQVVEWLLQRSRTIG